MRRHWESMNNDKKKSVAIGRALLSGPYLIWMIGFTIIPLALIFWYGITTKNGNLTLANITAIMSPDHWKALWLSLGLSLISTVLCLVLAYPLAMILRGRGSSASGFIVFIFILPMWMNFLLRTMAWQTLLDQRYPGMASPAKAEPDQHPGSHCPWNGIQLPSIHGTAYLQCTCKN